MPPDLSTISDADLLALIGNTPQQQPAVAVDPQYAELPAYDGTMLFSSPAAEERYAAVAAKPDLSSVSDDAILQAAGLPRPGALPTSGVNAVSGQLGKGLGLGWFDEFQGLEGALQNEVQNLFGRGNDKPFSENYTSIRDLLAERDANFEAESPWTARGLQLTGALAPALATGGASILTKGSAELAPGMAKRAADLLYGLGTKGVPTLKRMAAAGLVGGAVAGAGEAGEGRRLQGAALGGGAGLILAPLLGKGIQKSANVVTDFMANRGWLGAPSNPLASSVAAQRGSLSMKPTGGGLTPEEIILAKQLKNTPIEKILSGANEMEGAVSNDVPLFLPEALQSPKVDRNARFVANYEPSLDFSQSAIEARTKGAAARATQEFGKVSKEANAYAGANKMTDAADNIITSAKQARQDAADPLYKKAYKEVPFIKSEQLDDLLAKDQVLAAAIKKVKKTRNNADLADNSSRLLVKARSEIGDQIEDAIASGRGREARDLTFTYQRLNKILHSKNKALAVADDFYETTAGPLDDLSSSFLKNLSKMSADKVQNVSQIFNLPAERIAALRGVYEKAGKLDEWNAGIRAHLQNSLESTKEGSNFTDKLIGNTLKDSKLAAAVGDSYDDLAKYLKLEDRMFKGKNKYHAGSSTAGNVAEGQEFQESVSMLAKIKAKDWVGALTHIFKGSMPEETAQRLAKIYFDPKRGKEAIEKIIPLLKQYAANQSFSGKLGKGGTMAGSRTGGASTGDRSRALEAPKDQHQRETQRAKQAPSSARSSSPGKSSTNQSSSSKPTKNADLVTSAIDKAEKKVNENEYKSFKAKVSDIAANLEADPENLLKVMHFETGGTFSPSVKNAAGSGATGLIQFTPKTAKGLTGKDTGEAAIAFLSAMTPEKQLDYVEKHLKPFKGKIKSIEDLYMAVLWPAAVGKDSEYAIFREGTKAYWQNRGLDIDKDGIVTKAEAASKVKTVKV